MSVQWTELVVFLVLFLFVTVLGFYAARWKTGTTLDHLDEWGLGGRKFGSWITWFLIGGDLYTAYTFVAVPALIFGAGAMGFFALPYTVLVYPLVFLPLLATLIPLLYNRVEPTLFGIPFFYWYQLAAISVGVITTLIVYRVSRR